MATFNTTKYVPTALNDLSCVVATFQEYFKEKEYAVEVQDSSYGYFISMTKGNIFKTVLGMKTSLNIELKRLQGGVSIDAKVGIFAQQAVPSLIMLFVFWPVLLTQITGLIQQSKLDDEAIEVIESAIRSCEVGMDDSARSANRYCAQCGASIDNGAKFCSACGAKQ